MNSSWCVFTMTEPRIVQKAIIPMKSDTFTKKVKVIMLSGVNQLLMSSVDQIKNGQKKNGTTSPNRHGGQQQKEYVPHHVLQHLSKHDIDDAIVRCRLRDCASDEPLSGP